MRFSRKTAACLALSAAALIGAAAINAVPAQAATAQQGAAIASLPASAATAPRSNDNAVTVVLTFDFVSDPANSRCGTGRAKASLEDMLGLELAWYKMNTYYCWNGDIVTSHVTSETGGTTDLGSAGGWGYNGVLSSSFNCYIANGSNEKCSGNYEISQGSFQSCILGVCGASWYPTIQEWERYDGKFYAST